MLRIATLVLLLVCPLLASAQRRQPPSPEERLAAKLKSPFLKAVPWVRDYDKVRAESKRTGKLIFGYFTVTGP